MSATTFAPVSWAAPNAQVLSVHLSLLVKNLAELVALAKAEPGKLYFLTAGVAPVPRFTFKRIMRR